MQTFIYALKDPETRKIRYIGASERPEKRFRQHLRDSRRCHRTNWIESLTARGLLPEIEVLVAVPKAEWQEWERKFITMARAMGAKLVNGTDGGDGCVNPTLETRAKLRAGRLGKKLPESHREAMRRGRRGMRFSESHRASLSLVRLGKRQSSAHSAAISAGLKGKTKSSEHVAAWKASRWGKKK